jgi:hypothetical protein
LNKKISGLQTEYTNIINLLKESLGVVGDFTHKYSTELSRAQIIRKERFGLYPTIENNLIHVQGQFYDTSQKASELLDRTYQQLKQDAEKLTIYNKITVRELPQIDRLFDMIRTHCQNYTNLLEDFLADPINELLQVQEAVDELTHYRRLFDQYEEQLKFKQYELKIAAIKPIKLGLPDKILRRKGILFLTDKNLYFIPIIRFLFEMTGKLYIIPINTVREVEIENKVLFGQRMILKLASGEKMVIKGSEKKLEKLRFLFRVLFNDNEGYMINDPFLIQELETLDYSILRQKIDRRIKNLKVIPFHSSQHQEVERRRNIMKTIQRKYSSQESQLVKQLKIQLEAEKDNLEQLKQAWRDKNITPEIYFPRRRKVKERILEIESDLRDAKKQGYYSRGSNDSYSDSRSDFSSSFRRER